MVGEKVLDHLALSGRTTSAIEGDGSHVKTDEVLQALLESLATPAPAPCGVGFNCTYPSNAAAVSSAFTKSLRSLVDCDAEGRGQLPRLVMYPNGGWEWDAPSRKWSDGKM